MKSSIESVTVAVDWWLRQEVLESHAGRNRPLDDFELERRSCAAGPDSTDNLDAAKLAGHVARFKLAASALVEVGEETGDYLVAKLIHHGLMFVSGNFRTQAFLQASGQADYEVNRFGKNSEFNGAIGLDLKKEVGLTLLKGYEGISLEAINEQNLKRTERIYSDHMSIYHWFLNNQDRTFDALSVEDDPVRAAVECQKQGLKIALSYIGFVARLRKDASRVPFLEPKGITDVSPNPIYPIAT